MDTLQAMNQLEQTIEVQHDLLLHAECEEAVSYAQATYVARSLIDRSAA